MTSSNDSFMGTGLSASGQRNEEGDDLSRSRIFSLKAGAVMAEIVDASREPTMPKGLVAPGRDPAWLCERLSLIQREAKRARARAIYRSAQDVLTLIQRCNTHMPINWTQVDGRLFVLNKLLMQYEAGLTELEELTPPVLLQASDDSVGEDAAAGLAFDPVHEIAKQTLTCLLPHASGDERAALQRLMNVDLTPLTAEAERSVPVPSDKPVPGSDADASDPAQPATTADRLEWIMPDLVQNLLELGRQFGKIFSVSHSLDDVLIQPDSADEIYDRLFTALSDLIAGPLPLQGVGRLDISASATHLHISGSGFDPVILPLTERIETAHGETGPIDAERSAPAHAPAIPQPRITDDTEEDLRAQLSALMDRPLGEDMPS